MLLNHYNSFLQTMKHVLCLCNSFVQSIYTF